MNQNDFHLFQSKRVHPRREAEIDRGDVRRANAVGAKLVGMAVSG